MNAEKERELYNVDQYYKLLLYFQITPADHVCHACWQLAAHSQSSDNVQRRRVGHQSVCVVCGRSILRISRRRILIEGANEEQQRVANIVSTWIQPREVKITCNYYNYYYFFI